MVRRFALAVWLLSKVRSRSAGHLLARLGIRLVWAAVEFIANWSLCRDHRALLLPIERQGPLPCPTLRHTPPGRHNWLAIQRGNRARIGDGPSPAVVAPTPGHDPVALGWLWEHWGTTQPLRHVALADRLASARRSLGAGAPGWSWRATLAFLRSRLLLPGDTPEARAAEDETEAPRRRLVSRAEVRAARIGSSRRPRLGRDVFGCWTGQLRHDNGRVGDITELLRACLGYRRRRRSTVPGRRHSGSSATRLRQLLDALPNGSPLMAFLPEVDGTEPQRVLRGRVAVSSTPVAALELARERLGARSGCLWTPIRVRHRDDHSAVQDAVGPLA
jgi:hypothetical protein